MNGHARVKYDHPLFEKVLKKTYGIMVYQEQVTKIVHLLGGLSLAESDKVRDAIKKKNKDKLLKFKNVFIKGALKRGCKNKKEANRIFDLINSFSSYSFNKSHSCAYIIYSYMQMWFKVYYPIVFYYALLKYPKKDRRKKEEILKEIKDDIIRHDIPLKMPDVNISKAHPIIKKDSIVWGLTDIKYVGESYVNDIIKGQPYKSIEDYIERSGKGKNKRVIESLLKAGAFDRFEMSRKEQCREIFNVLDKDISKDFKDYKKDKFWIEKSEEVLGFVNYKRR